MKKTPKLKSQISKFLFWAVASFVAIALVESNALAGLAFALVSGVALGVMVLLK